MTRRVIMATAAMALLIAGSSGAAPPDPPAARIVHVTVDAARVTTPLPPIWRFFGADEPNYATLPEGRRLLVELGRLRPDNVYFRAHNLLTTGDGTPDFKWGSTNAYTERDGQPVYDWTIVDRIIDTYRAAGIHPYLEIGFMPEALSAAPKGTPYRLPWAPGVDDKGKTAGWTYPPRDQRCWADLVYRWTQHNVERYGRAEVERWYFQTWNEPNLSFYWSAGPKEFYRLHDVTVDAIRRALPTARVGGPDLAGSGGSFMDGFLKHVVTGTNYATGRTGTPTDFLSFHAKGQPVLVDGHVRMGIANQLRTADEAFGKFAAVPALAGKLVVIGENDPEGCAACPGPANAYRNGPLYASYTAASYARLWELARRRGTRLEGALSWSYTFVGQPWFAGYRQLATNGVDLAVMNVFRLFARLGPDSVAASSDGQIPLDAVLRDGVRGPADVGVIATRGADKRAQVLLWNYHDDDVPGPDARIDLRVSGVAPAAAGRMWRVDPAHANAFGAWQAMGSPAKPTVAQIAALKRASMLVSEDVRLKDGRLNLSLPRQGVALVEF